ncbi:MAG TPA: glycosyltransferase [Desulfobacterales bacterium]|nr:glycosyltransferase [Desulfobacterales bacterium]
MTILDLTKCLVKRRILLPAIHLLHLDKSKIFAISFNFLLTLLPTSEETRTRLKTEFLQDDGHHPPSWESRKTYRPTIPPDGDPVSYPPVRLIAFYLPQFHPILKDFKVMQQQTELAKRYGLAGFCFYFYWFGGTRLLEKPVRQYLRNKDIDQPFCLCWANENWSRRWDGLNDQILMAQNHSPADDLAFIKYISKYLRDPRYIRINNKPLLLVYRPSLLPAAKETARRWRTWCAANGIGEIYLAYTQSFETVDPRRYGFDAAIEFPPNNSNPPLITDQTPRCREDFRGQIYDWRVFLQRSKRYEEPEYPLFRGVCPSWDNTARLKNKSTIFLNNSPGEYRQWLTNAIFDTAARFKKKDERLVFVNAWNEWAEGAYLEPDQRFGRSYLEATSEALHEAARKITGRRLVLVAHDAHPHGAQFLILHMAKILRESMGFTVELILLGEGVLLEEYQKYANVHELAGLNLQSDEVVALSTELFRQGAKSAITNTTVSGLMVPILKQCGFKVISLVHELPQLIKDYKLQEHVKAIALYADKVIFAASPVQTGFESFTSLKKGKAVIRPQGLYKKNSIQSLKLIRKARLSLRKRFHLAKNSQIVLGVGFADYRKGIDIFVRSAIEILQKGRKVYFLWLGNFEPQSEEKIKQAITQSGFDKFFIFPGLDYNTDVYYAGADIYALTSREDPFPSVVLEALDAQTPVVAFSAAGGAAEILTRGGGVLVDEMNSRAFSTGLMKLIDSPDEAKKIALDGKKIIEEEFSFQHYLFDLLDLADVGLHRVSVVVPNYNYEQYIRERLQSIINQSYPVYEIIVLDDASTDKSLKVIQDTLKSQPIDYRVIINRENSGSVFKQWKKGIDLARGTHIWLAEADDSCSDEFLDEAITGFNNHGVVLSYCESRQMDEEGLITANNYHEYVADIDTRHWQSAFVKDGAEEIAGALSVKNTIPNVSGVVFERSCLKSVLREHFELIKTYRVAGDWLVYVLVLKYGKIAFSPLPLNFHRRHQGGVTIGSFNRQQLDEIKQMQTFIADNFEVSKEKSKLAEKYITTLQRQFGLLEQ